MCAGIGGAYIPLVLTPHWAEEMTAGRGWIALALVVFASWIPWRIIVGALIFGGNYYCTVSWAGKRMAYSFTLLSMMPYLATIIALTILRRLSKIIMLYHLHLANHFLVVNKIVEFICIYKFY